MLDPSAPGDALRTVMATTEPQPQGRRRSNTAQSVFRSATAVIPLNVDDSKVLCSWVHDTKDGPTIILNHAWWPGVSEGDLIRVTKSNDEDSVSLGFLFFAPKDDGCAKPQLQLSIAQPIAEVFGLRNNGEVTVTKVDRGSCGAEYVEFSFQDLYLGRNDMWRLTEILIGQCVYTGQIISFVGSNVAKVSAIYGGGKKLASGLVTSSTKTIFRSFSAKVMIFIQVCRELWEFSSSGERYYEKIVHAFLPTLFSKWREAGTNHNVSIVLISRVYYEESEIEYAAGPLLRDEEGRWYKDFFKVIVDLEVIHEWKEALVSLKNSFWAFRRDILLNHHYHQNMLSSTMPPSEPVRLVGQISYAHEGPILEAINLGLTPTETHFIDRSLSQTGTSTILITPGTGYFRVQKHLLRLTTTRMLDQGYGVDLFSLGKAPLHQSPIFSFWGVEPELMAGRVEKPNTRAMDPLWGGDDYPDEFPLHEKTLFWWEPFWMCVSFWDQQRDLPFREDRFVNRAKMHKIQMLGLLEQDVLSSIDVPLLSARNESPFDIHNRGSLHDGGLLARRQEADQFDNNVFMLKPDLKLAGTRASSSSGTILMPSSRSSTDRRSLRSQRDSISVTSSRFAPIEESPRQILVDLPDEEPAYSVGVLNVTTLGTLSTSPSQSSMRSVRSTHSPRLPTSLLAQAHRPRDANQTKTTLASRLAPSWLLNPFRSAPSEPQASTVAATASTTVTPSATPNATPKVIPIQLPPTTPTPQPTVGSFTAGTSALSQTSVIGAWSISSEERSHRESHAHHSPTNTPPRDQRIPIHRSSIMTASSVYSPQPRANPCKPGIALSQEQSSLTGQWQHLFPVSHSKHRIKWKSVITPGCLPLTVDSFPTGAELESSYDVTQYDFVIDPPEMRSFLIKRPSVKGNRDDVRDAWAHLVMRGMVAVRLAQGFQLVIRSHSGADLEDRPHLRGPKSLMIDDDLVLKPAGAADVLPSPNDIAYLSMTNEIHRISYNGETIHVKRWFRRMPPSQPIKYQCLLWPKFGEGYTKLQTSFTLPGLSTYGWNRLDMLVAGYEQQFSESLRYWRTRFVVIPTQSSPQMNVGPSGETLNEEETRILGMDKLAEIFTKLRYVPPEEESSALPPVRLLHTTLSPVACIQDELLMSKLDDIYTISLRKKMKSEREISSMSLANIAKAMREEDGLPIKLHMWHKRRYPDSFIGHEFASWLVREFRDISTRTQAAELGSKLLEQGLFEHCRGVHGFLDGNYIYRLKGEYAAPPSSGRWFKPRQAPATEEANGRNVSSQSKNTGISGKNNKRRLILSQSMVIDVDPNKRSDQAEMAILHHDIIHNPVNAFHFELQWIGTTPRLIDERIRAWSGRIERYGLRLVEAYVMQISDIRQRNPFQSCFPIPLSVEPPAIPKKTGEGTPTQLYFEYAILRKFGFVLDMEASSLLPSHLEVIYTYRRSSCDYSQFVDSSGAAFVQILGGKRGFLVLSNRLLGGRSGSSSRTRDHKSALAKAQDITFGLARFCEDENALNAFYREELEALNAGTEDPPTPST